MTALPLESIRSEFNQALSRADSGITAKQISPFGTTRLLSSASGVKDRAAILLGLEAIINDGWVLKKPNIVVDASPYQAETPPLFRRDLPVSKNWMEEYENKAVFPIILKGQPTKDVAVTVTAEWTACPKGAGDKACITEKKVYTLDLPATESFLTIWGSYIEQETLSMAMDIQKTKIQVKNILLSNGDLTIRFHFPRKVKALDIRSEAPYHFTQVGAKPSGKIWTVTLRPDKPIQSGDVIPFSLRTTYGCYILSLKVSNETLPPLPDTLPIRIFIWSGLFFFLLSPIWCLWLKPQALSNRADTFRKNLFKLRLGMVIAIAGLGILWILGIEPTRWIQFPVVPWLALIPLAHLILFPILPIGWACLGLVLLPKPFWDHVEFVSDTTKIGLLIWWFICCCLPFHFWAINIPAVLSYFKRIQKENIPAYFVIIRLPYLLLFGWLVLALSAPLWSRQDIPLKEGNIDLPAIVRITKPICFRCAQERSLVFSYIRASGIRMYQDKSSSKWAQQKRKEHLLRRESFNLLLLKDGREIVLPFNLSRKDLNDILTKEL